jgi:hypothetical protein
MSEMAKKPTIEEDIYRLEQKVRCTFRGVLMMHEDFNALMRIKRHIAQLEHVVGVAEVASESVICGCSVCVDVREASAERKRRELGTEAMKAGEEIGRRLVASVTWAHDFDRKAFIERVKAAIDNDATAIDEQIEKLRQSEAHRDCKPGECLQRALLKAWDERKELEGCWRAVNTGGIDTWGVAEKRFFDAAGLIFDEGKK